MQVNRRMMSSESLVNSKFQFRIQLYYTTTSVESSSLVYSLLHKYPTEQGECDADVRSSLPGTKNTTPPTTRELVEHRLLATGRLGLL